MSSCAGIFDLCDRILARINFNDGKDAEKEIVLAETAKNLERHRVKLSITKCLSAFLEGVSEREALHLLHQLDWSVIGSELISCFRIYEIDPDDSNRERYVEEGMAYYLLLRHMRCHDRSNLFIAPQLKALMHKAPRAVRFFESRAGYVEIVRNDVLERVFFQLPEACVASETVFNGTAALGEKTIAEMYVMDQREDFDTKNKDWLMNMAHIAETHHFQEYIRKTRLSFTVTKWESIQSLNFYWTLAMHIIMVLGGFMPPPLFSQESGMKADYEARLTASGGDVLPSDWGGRRKASSAGDVVEGQVEDQHSFSSQDVFFFLELHPVLADVLDLMSILNLVTCGVRFFAFLHSRLPMILAFALEAADEEVEGEANEGELLPDDSAAEERLDDGFFEAVGSLREGAGSESLSDAAALALPAEGAAAAAPMLASQAPSWCVCVRVCVCVCVCVCVLSSFLRQYDFILVT